MTLPAGKRTTILVVDDQKAMSRLIRRILYDFGLRDVVEADDGMTALSELRAQSFSLVISDLIMKPMSGMELLRQVRCDARLHQLPFLMVTGSGHADEVLAAKDAGVSGYIVKPFATHTLQKKVSELLHSH
jgi:two-component system, chemotaxis family, chemotaxis protein CheY